jgi:hypothetical protein
MAPSSQEHPFPASWFGPSDPMIGQGNNESGAKGTPCGRDHCKMNGASWSDSNKTLNAELIRMADGVNTLDQFVKFGTDACK